MKQKSGTRPHALRRLRPEGLRRDAPGAFKDSGSTSIAMSQRTPSHCPAIFSSSPIMAACVAGLP